MCLSLSRDLFIDFPSTKTRIHFVDNDVAIARVCVYRPGNVGQLQQAPVRQFFEPSALCGICRAADVSPSAGPFAVHCMVARGVVQFASLLRVCR